MANEKPDNALEFLLEYGWAILVAIIAVGISVYFLSHTGQPLNNSDLNNAGPINSSINNSPMINLNQEFCTARHLIYFQDTCLKVNGSYVTAKFYILQINDTRYLISSTIK